MPLVWVADLAAGVPGSRGRRWHGGQQAAPRTCERERGGGIKAARGMPLFAPELPFKRTFVLYGYTEYPRYKRAVYARFRGYFAAVQKIAPKNAGTLCRAVGTLRRWAALVGLEARRSCRRSEYLQRAQPPTAGAGGTPPSRRQRKAPAGFEPIGAGVYLEFFAASMSIKNGMSRIYNRITRLPPPRALSPRAPSFRGRGGGG